VAYIICSEHVTILQWNVIKFFMQFITKQYIITHKFMSHNQKKLHANGLWSSTSHLFKEGCCGRFVDSCQQLILPFLFTTFLTSPQMKFTCMRMLIFWNVAMLSCRNWPVFQGCLLPPSSGQWVPMMEAVSSPETSVSSKRLHGTTSQKTVILILSTMRTWNLKFTFSLC
jgi:hypothetical protein